MMSHATGVGGQTGKCVGVRERAVVSNWSTLQAGEGGGNAGGPLLRAGAGVKGGRPGELTRGGTQGGSCGFGLGRGVGGNRRGGGEGKKNGGGGQKQHCVLEKKKALHALSNIVAYDSGDIYTRTLVTILRVFLICPFFFFSKAIVLGIA